MGWYHDANFKWDDDGNPTTTTCSIANRPKKEEAPNTPPEEMKASGSSACPLPPSSAPPPPPPDVNSIYHLCQASLWEEAVKNKMPYFPPTYMNDGKFTRASAFKEDLVVAANEYYRDVPGDWLAIELDCTLLFGLGIPILSQDAPESTRTQPVKCLQIFGGISTTLPGLVKNVYEMKRRRDGTFLQVLQASADRQEEEKKEESPAKGSGLRFWPRRKKQ